MSATRHPLRDGAARAVAGTLLASLLGAIPLTAQPTLVTDEIQVDGDARSRQRDPVALALDDGSSLIVWQEDRHGIFGHRLDASGQPVGDDLRLAESTTAEAPFSGRLRLRKDPSAALLGDGDVLVAWTEEQQFVTSFPFIERRMLRSSDVFARVVRTGAAGGAEGSGPEVLGEPVRLSGARGGGIERAPELARLPDGSVLVAWTFRLGEVSGIRARVLDASGAPSGGVFEIDAAAGLNPKGLDLTAHPNGSVLATWHACCDGGGDLGIFGSVVDVESASAGPVVRINDLEENVQANPASAVLDSGEFLVAWQSSTGIPEPIYDGWRVRAQALSADGALVGPASQLSDGMGWGHTDPDLSVGETGVVLVWLTWVGDVPGAVVARALDAAGEPADESFFVSTARTLGSPSITALGGDRNVVTWISSIDLRRGVSVRLLDTVDE